MFADLLFMDGMEAVFRVALVLLRTHEEALLACDSFEQIMDYMKTSLSNLHTNQIGNIISQVSYFINFHQFLELFLSGLLKTT